MGHISELYSRYLQIINTTIIMDSLTRNILLRMVQNYQLTNFQSNKNLFPILLTSTGECFWDPLRILDGTSESVKRNMQARELNNGRFAMVAVLSYILQEGITHQPLITLPWNQVLFEPAFEIPAVQAWLDAQFSGAITGKGVMLIEQERVLEGGEVVKMIIIEDPSTAASATAEVGLGVGTDSVDMDALKDGVEATMDTVTD